MEEERTKKDTFFETTNHSITHFVTTLLPNCYIMSRLQVSTGHLEHQMRLSPAIMQLFLYLKFIPTLSEEGTKVSEHTGNYLKRDYEKWLLRYHSFFEVTIEDLLGLKQIKAAKCWQLEQQYEDCKELISFSRKIERGFAFKKYNMSHELLGIPHEKILDCDVIEDYLDSSIRKNKGNEEKIEKLREAAQKLIIHVEFNAQYIMDYTLKTPMGNLSRTFKVERDRFLKKQKDAEESKENEDLDNDADLENEGNSRKAASKKKTAKKSEKAAVDSKNVQGNEGDGAEKRKKKTERNENDLNSLDGNEGDGVQNTKGKDNFEDDGRESKEATVNLKSVDGNERKKKTERNENNLNTLDGNEGDGVQNTKGKEDAEDDDHESKEAAVNLKSVDGNEGDGEENSRKERKGNDNMEETEGDRGNNGCTNDGNNSLEENDDDPSNADGLHNDDEKEVYKNAGKKKSRDYR